MPGRKLRGLSLRDALAIAIPSLLLLLAGFWATAQFIRPAPPAYLVLASGSEGGAYQLYAARYKQILARNGIDLRELPTAGALENLQRLRDPQQEVDVAFIQGGTTYNLGLDLEKEPLVSLGSLYNEPLWVFYRGDAEIERLTQFKGKRLAIGSEGSGSRKLALELLEASGIAAGSTQLLESGGMTAVADLLSGKADAVFVVGSAQSAAVWSLLYSEGVRLMSFSQADAYPSRFPHLSKVTLPQGAIDLVRGIPVREVTLLAPVATLVARNETHPALIDLLVQAAAEVHGGAALFQRAGEFPSSKPGDFPLSKEAERYYKSGKPFLQRYLPFWAATLVDRLAVMIIPILALLYPLFKITPFLYTWRVRSRIYRRYGELKFLEKELAKNPAERTQEEWQARLDRIEADVSRLTTPLAFSDQLYTLRGHIALVREAIARKAAV